MNIKKFWNRLVSFNDRDLVGLIAWFLASLIVGFICLPIMIVREIYQYKKFHLSHFEWEDVVRYGLVIVLGSLLNFHFIF